MLAVAEQFSGPGFSLQNSLVSFLQFHMKCFLLSTHSKLSSGNKQYLHLKYTLKHIMAHGKHLSVFWKFIKVVAVTSGFITSK